MTPEEIIEMVDNNKNDMNEFEWSILYSYISYELCM